MEDVLLPIAAELGLPFTLKDLRAFETRHKLENAPKADAPIQEGEAIEDPVDYSAVDPRVELRLRVGGGPRT